MTANRTTTHVRAAGALDVATETVTLTREGIERETLERHSGRLARVAWLMIFVSVVHMASTLLLFSDVDWASLGKQEVQANGFVWWPLLITNVGYVGAAFGMIVSVDYATWSLASFIDYSRRRLASRGQLLVEVKGKERQRMPVPGYVMAVFVGLLALSFMMNAGHLWAHRPVEAKMPWWVAAPLATLYGLLVPALVGVASVLRGQLDVARLELDLSVAQSEVPTVTTVKRERPTLRPISAASGGSNEAPVQAPALPAQGDAPMIERVSDAPAASREPAAVPVELPLPPVVSPGNAKADFKTTDAPGLAGALLAANVKEVQSGAHLGRLVGWSASASGPKGLRTLLDAGVLHEQTDAAGTRYVLDREAALRVSGGGEAVLHAPAAREVILHDPNELGQRLDGLLGRAGFDRQRARDLMSRFRLDTPAKAHDALKGRSPEVAAMSVAEFTPLYNLLMAG